MNAMVFPASPAQRRIMVVEALVPGTAAYHVPLALRLRGELDVDALRSALAAVVDRHEALRTAVDTVEGEQVQVVAPAMELPLEPVDVRRSTDLSALLAQRAAEPFALNRRLIRADLFRVAADHHVLAVTLHHLVCDMWSCGILVQDLADLYNAAVRATPASLPDLPVQYADYTLWQLDQLAGDGQRRLTDYWRRTLDRAPALLELPPDRPRPARRDLCGDSQPVRLAAATSDQVRELSKRLSATPFVVLLTAVKLVVSRWTGQTDVVVSTGVATRTGQVERVVGCFVNVVPLRTSLAGEPSFAELVGRVRATVVGALEHQDLPFERMVADAGRRPDLSHQPLTQVMFLLQTAPLPAPAMAGLAVTAVPVPRTAAQLDVNLQLWDGDDGFHGFVEFATDMYDADTMRRLWGHVETVLATATAQPCTPARRLPMLTAREQRAAVAEWNDTAAPAPDLDLYALFAAQAVTRPDAVAVLHPGGRVTYGELGARAEALARRLRSAGVGPDVVVGVCLGRTVLRAVAILAVLAAGGAYLPLDPEYPPERLGHMMRDAGPLAVLTDGATAAALPAGSPPVIRVDVPQPGGGPVPGRRDPDSLAYVIYTSGSTGRPKGIAVTHRGVVNNIADLNRLGQVGPADRVLALSSASFDMSVYEVLGLLAAGGTVVLPDPSRAIEPAHWAQLVRDRSITVWNSAPALLEALLSTAGPGQLASLRVAFLGGDWIPLNHPARLRAHNPDVRFIALGGATEASIHSVVHSVDSVDPRWLSIPYGRPMHNQQALVLDGGRQPVPVGVAGELHLGGIGLARGYLGRPARTASRFVPHPFAGRYPQVPPGARLYRTGDLARYWADGTIELLGRMDHQVKVRGFRIELGEVGAVLRRHPGVAEAVVTSERSAGGDVRLVAFYVPQPGEHPEAAALRGWLRATLPDYMVPAAFTALDRLPLSPNGKVDRGRLPRAVEPAGEPRAGYAAPVGPVEALLADLWATALEAARIGRHDDFFDLGGHSLHAARITAMVREVLDVEVPLRLVFEEPTVAAQAAELAAIGRRAGHDVERLAVLALQVKGLSDEEVDRMLAGEAP